MTTFFRRCLNAIHSSTGTSFDVFMGGNVGQRNVLLFTEHLNATYHLSFEIPLRRIHARGGINLAVVSQQSVTSSHRQVWKEWMDVFRPDVVVMSRYGHSTGPAILRHFQACGIPVIYHIDDDLLELPPSLGEEIIRRQGHPDVVDVRFHLLRKSDLIYASTSYLANRLLTQFPEQRIVHGIYAPYLERAPHNRLAEIDTRQVIGYMGSKGHHQDLQIVIPALERLLDERADLEFEVFGTIGVPWRLQRFGNRVRRYGVKASYYEFLDALATMKWDVALAPLIDIPFNRCKAPTKFIEYTGCGFPVVASNGCVYAPVIPKDGGMLVDEDWYGPIHHMLESAEYRMSAVAIARAHCSSAFHISVLERQLTSIIDQAISLQKATHES